MTLNILIVEDEAILAVELECIIRELGHNVVGIATSSSDAITLANRKQPDLALVDVNLKDGPTGPDAARKLAEEGQVAVLFTTSNPDRIPSDFAKACGLVTKPYSEHGLKAAITFLSECLVEGKPKRSKPHGLVLAPHFTQRWGSQDNYA